MLEGARDDQRPAERLGQKERVREGLHLVAPAAVRHIAQLAVRTCGARRSLKEGVEARTGRLQLSHQGGRQGIRR